MKKVLIISYSFPPDNVPAAQRPYYMAKYLPLNGYEVKVLTAENSNSSLGKSSWADLSGLDIVRVNAISFGKKKNISETIKSNNHSKSNNNSGKIKISSFLKRLSRDFLIPDKGIFWYKRALKAAEKIINENSIEYVFSTSPLMTNHRIAVKLKEKFNIKWVADFRDFFFIEMRENDRYLFRKHFDRKLEKKILAKADRIVFVSELMKNEYEVRYKIPKDRTQTIFNGFDDLKTDSTYKTIPAADKMKIFYAGSFYDGERSTLPLLAAVDYLIKEGMISDREFEINIAGNIPECLIRQMKPFISNANVNMMGQIDRKKVLEEMRSSHLLWLITGESKVHKIGFSVKGMEYIEARRPILVFTPADSEPSLVINEMKCGTRFSNILDKENIKENALKLLDFFNKFRSGEINKPILIDETLLLCFKRDYQAKQLADILRNI